MSTDGDTVRWLLGGAVLAGGVLAACGNAWIALTARRRLRETGHHTSPVPVIGGVAIAAGLLLLPSSLPPWIWLVALVDLGTLAVPVSLVVIAWRARQRER